MHSRERTLGERARDFGSALRRLTDKAYPSVDSHTRDMLAKDQFIAKIGSGDVRIQLRSAKTESLENAMDLASDLEQMKALERKETVAALNMFPAERSSDAWPLCGFNEFRR